MPSTADYRRKLLSATAARVAFLAALGLPTLAGAQDLASFAVLGGSGVTNTGPTIIGGNVGVSPSGSFTGFPPGTITAPYTSYIEDAVAAEAQSQLTSAYNILAARITTQDLTSQNLGGLTLVPGVYNFDEGAALNGILTLDAQGDPDAIFIFNIGSTLTAAEASQVLLINDAHAGNVFFRVGSSATLLAGAEFRGKILALASISMVSGASIDCGAALARTGAVTLINNVINICAFNAVDISAELDEEATEQDREVANAIDDYVNGGSALPIGFQVLAALSTSELAEALGQLSGQIATASGPSAREAMNSFLDTVGTRRGPGTLEISHQDEAPDRGTVSVMGYMPVGEPFGGGAFDFYSVGDLQAHREWNVWSAAFGGYRLTEGDAEEGTSARASSAYGIAVGFERLVGADGMVGLALSGGGTNFDLDDGLSSGHSGMLQAAVYGRVDLDPAYISGALAYSIHDMHTDRYVTFAGYDHFEAEFLTHDIAIDVEFGYSMGWLTPYAGLRGQLTTTPAYEETTTEGASTFALGYDANAVFTARSELGMRAEWSAELEASTFALHAEVAWLHDFASDDSLEAYFLALPGSSFTTGGATAAADALLVSVGAGMQFDSGLGLHATVGGELAENSYSYNGNVRLSYRW